MAPSSLDNLLKSRNRSKTIRHTTHGMNKTVMDKFHNYHCTSCPSSSGWRPRWRSQPPMGWAVEWWWQQVTRPERSDWPRSGASPSPYSPQELPAAADALSAPAPPSPAQRPPETGPEAWVRASDWPAQTFLFLKHKITTNGILITDLRECLTVMKYDWCFFDCFW